MAWNSWLWNCGWLVFTEYLITFSHNSRIVCESMHPSFVIFKSSNFCGTMNVFAYIIYCIDCTHCGHLHRIANTFQTNWCQMERICICPNYNLIAFASLAHNRQCNQCALFQCNMTNKTGWKRMNWLYFVWMNSLTTFLESILSYFRTVPGVRQDIWNRRPVCLLRCSVHCRRPAFCKRLWECPNRWQCTRAHGHSFCSFFYFSYSNTLNTLCLTCPNHKHEVNWIPILGWSIFNVEFSCLSTRSDIQCCRQ